MNLLDLMVKIGVDDQATEKIGGIASGIESKLGTAAKVGATAVAAVGAAATAATVGITKAANDVASYGDNIEKMSQKMGMSFEAYQEWDAVMQHSGTSMETMKAGMKTLANAAMSGNEAFQRLGLSQEQVASMSQEELFEATIAGLQGVTDTTERTYLAGQLLGRGATELGALLNMSAEDTQAMRDRVHELGGVMSDEAVKASARFQDSLQDMQTAMAGLKRNAMAEFLPGMATVMDGLANIFSGDTGGGAAQISEGINQIVEKLRETIPKFVEVVSELAPILLQALVEVITILANELPSLVMQLVPILIDLAPTILEAGLKMFMSLVQALTETGPDLFDKLVDVMTKMTEMLVDYAPEILVATVQLMAAMVEAIIRKAPEITAKLVELLGRLVQDVIDHAPDMLAAAGEFVLQLVSALADGVRPAMDAANNLVQGILDTISGFIDNMFSMGADLVQGLINGIWNNIGGVGDALLGGLGDAWQSAKNFLGIASPSKLFAEIGKNMMLGLAEGIDDTAGKTEKSLSDTMDEIMKAFDEGKALSRSDSLAKSFADMSSKIGSKASVSATNGSQAAAQVVININDPVIRETVDADRLLEYVEDKLQRKVAMLTWNPSASMV